MVQTTDTYFSKLYLQFFCFTNYFNISATSEEPTSGKPRSVYLTPHQQESYKMAPQPPTSSGQTSMGPPPPPPPATTSNNVTFVLINQTPSQTNLMRPPIEPPPRRGRGRGRGRGGGGSGGGSTSPSESSGGRGRGRGRGRGAARIQPPPVERIDHQVIYIIFKLFLIGSPHFYTMND